MLGLLPWCTINILSRVLASLRSLGLVLPQESPASHFACVLPPLSWVLSSVLVYMVSCDLALGAIRAVLTNLPFRLALSRGHVQLNLYIEFSP